MSVPAFIDLDENDQVRELRAYLKQLGAEISEENSEDGLIKDMAQIIEASSVCLKDPATEQDVETTFNSIISLILLLPLEKYENLVTSLCEKLAKTQPGDRRNLARLHLLNNLFHGLDERSAMRYSVYLAMVKLAGQGDLMHILNPNLTEIKKWVATWDVSTVKVQNMLRSLHEAFVETKSIDKATSVMIELLGTYTEENASQARDDAHKCIVTCLADPNTYIMDHLLTLKPVKFLEGELIHDLLTIFVSGRLSQYTHFYDTNKDFVNSLGLSHEANLQKMRILTFMSMAENNKEIDFHTVQNEMKLGKEEVEPFIIDVIRSRQVRAKMDQMNNTVVISSTTHRTFGRQHWQILREKLDDWRINLNIVLGSLQSIQNVQS